MIHKNNTCKNAVPTCFSPFFIGAVLFAIASGEHKGSGSGSFSGSYSGSYSGWGDDDYFSLFDWGSGSSFFPARNTRNKCFDRLVPCFDRRQRHIGCGCLNSLSLFRSAGAAFRSPKCWEIAWGFDWGDDWDDDWDDDWWDDDWGVDWDDDWYGRRWWPEYHLDREGAS